MYFLTSNSRLNEQVVDKIILQLNRVYPQILTNAEAEKVMMNFALSLNVALFLRVSSSAARVPTGHWVPRAASLPHLLLAGQLYLGSHIRGEVTGLARSLCQVLVREGTLFSSGLMPRSPPWCLAPRVQKHAVL